MPNCNNPVPPSCPSRLLPFVPRLSCLTSTSLLPCRTSCISKIFTLRTMVATVVKNIHLLSPLPGLHGDARHWELPPQPVEGSGQTSLQDFIPSSPPQISLAGALLGTPPDSPHAPKSYLRKGPPLPIPVIPPQTRCLKLQCGV